MIEKPCYICRSGGYTSVVVQTTDDHYLSLIDPALNAEARAIVRGDTCGFSYHSPTLSDSEIHTLYQKFRDTDFRGETPDTYFDRITSYPKDQSQNYQKTVRLNDLVLRFLPPKGHRSVYDVGSGGGVFLKTFLDHADGTWSAYGCEPTPSYAELSRRRLGIPIVSCLYEPRLFDRRFELITAIKVVEHASDPIAFLSGLREDLLDDGVVYVEVPNSREVFRLAPHHDQLLYVHLHFFSLPVFEYVCARAGFDIVWKEEPESASGEVDLVVALKKAPVRSANEFTFPLQDRASFDAQVAEAQRQLP